MIKKQSLTDLVNSIIHHRHLYYSGRPEISDADYDKLEGELRKKDPHHPVLDEVGSLDDSAKKLKHHSPMLSLQKVYTEKELLKWQDQLPVVGTWKVDGNSLSLIYRNGDLVVAKTRGDGKHGEDVTAKAKWVPSIPTKIAFTDEIEIRGELYCDTNSFSSLVSEMVKNNLERPSSPRNIVAGVLGRKSHLQIARFFDFLAFDLMALDLKKPLEIGREIDKFNWFSNQGFQIPDPQLITNADEVSAYLKKVEAAMSSGTIGLDGAVFVYDDIELQQQKGSTAHHPRYKMSFKWQGETRTSKITDIIWNTSRAGIVTPVAVIEPTSLSGAIISNITLHNAKTVSTYDLKIGDEIEFIRSGEVIPKFLRVTKAAPGQHQWPHECPDCQTKLKSDDVRLICTNNTRCPAQLRGSILNWIRCVEIEDLSEKRLQNMLDQKLIGEISDLYRLTIDDLMTLPLTGEKMATKLLENISSSQSPPLARFLSGLGISGMGITSWEKLLMHAHNLEKVRQLTVDNIAAIDGFATKTAEAIVIGLQQQSQQIAGLLAAGVNPQNYTPPDLGLSTDGPLAGKNIVITGKLTQPRSWYQQKIESAGGKFATSITKNTSILICSDPASQSSKMQKARNLGVKIWSEADFEQACGAL